MTKTLQPFNRLIASCLLAIFINSICPSLLFANSNAPQASEASAFEPVDASDMVNLSTGDLTYVIPLLNVPSPEGGYPLALSYHGPIAMDQEASWVGLGWSLNPGSITRSINGAPDDWKESNYFELLYDEGDEEIYHSASVGISNSGYGSFGLGVSWGAGKGLKGHVSLSKSLGAINAGLNISSNGIGLNSGVQLGNWNIGMNTNSFETFGASVGYGSALGGVKVSKSQDNFSVQLSGLNSSTSAARTSSIGMSLSSNALGVNIGYGKQGTGSNIQTINRHAQSFYTTSVTGWEIPIMFPMGNSQVYATYGRQKVKWWLDQQYKHSISGPLYFNNAKGNYMTRTQFSRSTSHYLGRTAQDIHSDNAYHTIYGSCRRAYAPPFDKSDVCLQHIIEQYDGGQVSVLEIGPDWFTRTCPHHYWDYVRTNWGTSTGQSVCDEDLGVTFYPNVATNILRKPSVSSVINNSMDVYELGISTSSFSDKANPNAVFPNYDNYVVMGQGILGSMKPRLFSNGNLIGLGRIIKEDYLSFYSTYLNPPAEHYNLPDRKSVV